jgi:hypothetical protein
MYLHRQLDVDVERDFTEYVLYLTAQLEVDIGFSLS